MRVVSCWIRRPRSRPHLHCLDVCCCSSSDPHEWVALPSPCAFETKSWVWVLRVVPSLSSPSCSSPIPLASSMGPAWCPRSASGSPLGHLLPPWPTPHATQASTPMDPPTWIPTWHPRTPHPTRFPPRRVLRRPGFEPRSNRTVDRFVKGNILPFMVGSLRSKFCNADETGMRGRRTNGGDGRSTLRRLKWRQQSPRRSDGHNTAQE